MPVSNPGGTAAVYITVAKATKTGANTSAYVDWDLSATIPTGSTHALIVGLSSAGSSLAIGVRPNGSAIDNKVAAAILAGFSMLVELDSSRICEVYDNNGGTYNVIGYWK